MKAHSSIICSLSVLLNTVFGAPAVSQSSTSQDVRIRAPASAGSESPVNLSTIPSNENGFIGSSGRDAFSDMLNQLRDTKPQGKPATVEDALQRLSTVPQKASFSAAINIAQMGFIPGNMSGDVVDTIQAQQNTDPNSKTNNNPKEPSKPVFPSKASGDAPYSLDEQTLRGAIFIPQGFTYGQKQPVIVSLPF